MGAEGRVVIVSMAARWKPGSRLDQNETELQLQPFVLLLRFLLLLTSLPTALMPDTAM